MVFILVVFLSQVFIFLYHNLYCFVFISVYVMLLLAVLVTIGPSAFNKFGLIWLVYNSLVVVAVVRQRPRLSQQRLQE